MELLKDLELVEVTYNDTKSKVVLTFLDEENGVIREVNFNRQSYDRESGKFIDNAEKAAQVDEWCDTHFGTTFDKLKDCVGVRKDIYAYDNFSSLWESQENASKFTKDMVGDIYQTSIKEIIVDEFFIRIRYEIEGKTYESKQTFGKYMEGLKRWFLDPVKKEREYAKFEEKYHVPVSRKDELIGHPLMVEVKCAFGTAFYGDIKKFK